jgi:four helix bundle protein
LYIGTVTIHKFTDLNAWKEAHSLVLITYKEVSTFPKTEQFGLIGQMKRAAVSISSNIAEGFSRQGNKEKLQFYFVAKGSLTELENQITIARDLTYLDSKGYQQLASQIETVGKLLTGLIKCIRSRR